MIERRFQQPIQMPTEILKDQKLETGDAIL